MGILLNKADALADINGERLCPLEVVCRTVRRPDQDVSRAHAGGLKPPDPLGMPWGRTLPADINLWT